MFANEAVDVLGVVDTVADSAMIQTRDGKDVRTNTSILSHVHEASRVMAPCVA